MKFITTAHTKNTEDMLIQLMLIKTFKHYTPYKTCKMLTQQTYEQISFCVAHTRLQITSQ